MLNYLSIYVLYIVIYWIVGVLSYDRRISIRKQCGEYEYTGVDRSTAAYTAVWDARAREAVCSCVGTEIGC